MNNDFFYDLSRGAQGETLVANAFTQMGYEVMSVSKNPMWFKKDVDLMIWDNDGTQYKFEVKADWSMHRTGNVILELTSKVGTPGWFETTESDHLVFCDMENRIGYVFRTEELRDYVQKDPELDRGKLNGCECIILNINNCNSLYQKIRL